VDSPSEISTVGWKATVERYSSAGFSMGCELWASSAPVLSGFVAVPWRDMGVCHEMLESDRDPPLDKLVGSGSLEAVPT